MDSSKRNRQNSASRNRYNAKRYTSVTFRLDKDGGSGVTPEQIRQAAADAGQSVNQWIIDAIINAM